MVNFRTRWLGLRTLGATALLATAAGISWSSGSAQAPAQGASAIDTTAFEKQVKPFFQQNCVRCHNEDTAMAGVRVDGLDAGFEDRHVRLWEAIRHRVDEGTMPPKGMAQPSPADRQQLVAWVTRGLEVARSRPTPKNGLVRRLTVSQYRNTLRELLQLDDDLTEILPPDAISRDGFVNNAETLQLSPLLVEAYLEIAGEALHRAIVNPSEKPVIQNFRMDFGAGINPAPLPEELILGANSLLLDNKEYLVTELTPQKPFAFEPFHMRTQYRFIEGYKGNATVRGWRDFDSIYHSVFACMRGSGGYPKGRPYSTVKEGLLLRPAIPTDELFGSDGTYGPKANFKISLRELPDNGKFRVIVTAAKYNDGLLLDPGAAVGAGEIATKPGEPVVLPKAGIYQVDVHAGERRVTTVAPDASRLSEGLAGSWDWNQDQLPTGARVEGNAKLAVSPFGKGVNLDGVGDALVIPRDSKSMDVGEGDFTIAAWIRPRQLRKSGLIGLGGTGYSYGWYLDMPDNKGVLRLETSGPDESNGTVTSPPGVIRANAWQHVAAVVKRGTKDTVLYVNGFAVAKGEIGKANLDNPKMDLQLGRLKGAIAPNEFLRGDLDEIRLYRRPLSEAEIQALVEPGKQFQQPPPEKPQTLTLTLGDREFSGILEQPAFVAVRLPAGSLPVSASLTGVRKIERIAFTPVPDTSAIARRFVAFEKRSPKLGVHLGFRRDCGSTFAPVGEVQTVSSEQPARFVFEGAIRNYPSPDVEKDNVNYLAGFREIAVRSEFTDGRDMPRLVLKSVEFEGPYYDAWPPPSHQSIFGNTKPQQQNSTAYARQVINRFATRAYRRPVTPAEEAALMDVFTKSYAGGKGQFAASVKDALQVVLTSPQFLLLIEKSSTPGPEALDSYELASKLSYFLWNGPPDARTLQLAASGSLRKQLDAETDRMIADPRFARFIQEFVPQWLSLDKFQVLEPDRNRFPKLTRDTRKELGQEPVQFVQHLIRQNLPARNLISSDFVMANEVVASYYDLGDRTESGFRFLPLAHGRPELGGVLTQAALMAGLSDGRESNPVKRGAWVARKIVAEPPADPPPNVPALKEDPQEQMTLRQRLEQHRNQPGCQQCHLKIDPWGVALEEFDAGGRLKKEQADARSTLPDKTEVTGVADLKRYLGDDRIDQVAFSVLKHLATYASGRTLSHNEMNHLKQDSRKLRAGGYRMKDLVHYVVNSNVFLEK
jgi:mono/diheme cytochrome c family protein